MLNHLWSSAAIDGLKIHRVPATTCRTNGRVLERLDEPGELAAVNGVIEDALSTWGVTDRVRRLALTSLTYAPHDLDHITLLLTRLDGTIVGVAACEEPSPSAQDSRLRHLPLHGLYVAARHQRSGVGSSLLGGVIEEALRLGCVGVTARAWRSAERFFLSRGFTPDPGAGSGDAPPRRLRRALP